MSSQVAPLLYPESPFNNNRSVILAGALEKLNAAKLVADTDTHTCSTNAVWTLMGKENDYS